MAYPVGVGTNYIDPRKSNYTKTQSLAYNNGINAVKDLAETTSNPAPQPTDLLGTNLRRGKGLTFVKGIAQFGGFIQGSGIKNAANFSMSAAAAKDNRPLSASYANGRLLSGFQQQARTLSAQRAANSKQGVSIADVEASRMSDRQAPHQDYGRDDVSSASKSGFRLRPHSAPASRSQQAAMPIWAQEPLFIPSWDKTVDNSKPRPGSAKYRPSSGLPLSHIPSWISLDKQVLSYEAYFKEAVEESPLERSRVRRCVIQYFLEDDTIKISEPREENSGMPQGSFLKRHKVPKGQGSGGIVTWRDIPVPGDLSLYGRTFRVTRCDEFTSQFYASQGVSVNSLAEDVPMDPLHKMIARSRPSSSKTQNSYCLLNSSVGRAAEIAAGKAGNSQAPADGSPIFYGRQINDLKGYMEAQLGRCQDRKELVSKYLANDRKVLRFYCTWDDKDPDGVVDKRPFVLHFFLADDTVEVLEVNSPNSGRDPFPALLKRMKLPVAYAGAAAGITGTGGGGAERYYTAQDLRVGGVVSVYGRQLMLNSCDESTSRYYLEAHGVHMAAAPAPPRPPRPQSAVIVPPHNGFGREEDARQNCLSLHPKPPRQNVIRLLENKGKMLRFVGKMESATGFDVERVFVVSYFLDTDEITIFEPPVKNSGRSGGKFAERCRVRKPGSAEYYAEADMHLGARLVVNCRVFVLVDADDFSMKYMEAHPEVFPLSDVEGIVRRVEARAAAVEEQLRHADPAGTGVVEAEDFKAAVMASVPGLHEQEIHTLARTLTPAGESRKVQYSQLLRRGGGGGGGAGGGVGGGGGGGGGGENRPGSSGGGGWHGGSAMAQSKAASRRGEDFPGGGGGGGDAAEYALERLKELLYRRGPAGVRGLERAMKHISRGSGHLDRADLDTVLGFCGVSMSEEVVSALFRRFDAGDGVMRGGELVGALRPRLSSAGAAAVAQVFQSLEDPTFRTGAVEVEEVLDRFRPGRHPRVLSGEMSEAEARRELEEALEGLNAVVVGDLAGYYADVVAGYRLGDEELLELLRLTWGLGSRR